MDTALAQFREVIGGILSPDNDIRRQAEQVYDSMQQDVNVYFTCLIRLLKVDAALNVRSFCAVILRQQLLPAKKLWNETSVDVKNEIKATLYELFSNESNEYIRNKVIDAMAMLASRLFKEAKENNVANPTDAWPEVLPLTLNGCSHPLPAVRVACFSMLEKLAEFCVTAFIPQAGTILEKINEGFSGELPIALAASRAGLSILVSACLLATQPPSPSVLVEIQQGQQLQAAFLPVAERSFHLLATALNASDDSVVNDVLDALQSLARVHPQAFKPQLPQLVALVNQIARKDDFEVPLRAAAVTLLLSLGKSPAGRAIVRKCAAYSQTLLPLTFDFLVRVEHSAAWEREEVFDDEEENPLHHTAIFLLQSLVTAVGAKEFVPLTMHIATQYAAQPLWTFQCAAFTALATVAAECPKHFAKKALETPVTLCVKVLSGDANAHPRVKHAALALVSAVAENLTPKLAAQLLPVIATCLDPTANAVPVLAHAANAVAYVLGAMDSKRVVPHVPAILGSVTALLRGDSHSVKLSALSVISTVALVTKEQFAPYATDMLAGLAGIVSDANDKGVCVSYSEESQRVRGLRGKAIETISVVAGSVGKHVFLPFADQIMRLIAQAQALETSSDTPSLDAIFHAYERVSECLEEDFAPYLSLVVPPMLRTAAVDNFAYYFDVDEHGEMSAADAAKAAELTPDKGYSSLTINMRGAGNKKLFLNTTAVQDKIVACELLGSLAVSLREAYAPFVGMTAEVLLPLCTNTQNPRVRVAAVTALPALLDSAKISAKDEATLLGFWAQCLQALQLEVWVEKELPSGLGPLLLSVAACVDVLPSAVPAEHVPLLAKALVMALELSQERRRSMEAAVEQTDEEAVEDQLEAMEQENQCLEAISALSTSLVKKNTAQYMALFDSEVAPRLQQLVLRGQKDPYAFATALVIFADTIGNAKEHAHKYIPHALPLFLKHVSDVQDHDLRRGCAYGIVACVREMGIHYQSHVEATLQGLLAGAQAVFEDPEDEERCEGANDNVLSALAEVVTVFGLEQRLLPEDVVREVVWRCVDALPRIFDEEEAVATHHRLAQWLTLDPTLVFGKQHEHLRRVATVFSELLQQAEDYCILEEEDEKVIRAAWAAVREGMSEAQYAELWNTVDAELRGYLHK